MDKATLHKRISYWKSALRLAGYAVIFSVSPTAAFILILSEVLGVAEEVWGA